MRWNTKIILLLSCGTLNYEDSHPVVRIIRQEDLIQNPPAGCVHLPSSLARYFEETFESDALYHLPANSDILLFEENVKRG